MVIFPLPLSNKQKGREELDNKGDFLSHLNDECMTSSVLLYFLYGEKAETCRASFNPTYSGNHKVLFSRLELIA